MTTADGLDALRHAYANRLDAARRHVDASGLVAGTFGTGAPDELFLASGFWPCSLSLAPMRTPSGPALRYFEADIARGVFTGLDLLLRGEAGFAQLAVMVSRHKQDALLYHCAKEVLRRGEGGPFPPLFLFSILGDQIPAARDYSIGQMRALASRLKASSGVAATPAAIANAAQTTNAVRAAGRAFLALRRQGGVESAEALEIIGASRFMGPDAYLHALEAHLNNAGPAATAKPKVMLVSGEPLHHTSLHQALEAGGLRVTAEDDAFGSRAFTPDIVVDGDPFEALVDHYSRHNPNRAVCPHTLRWGWFYAEAAKPDIDAVVFHAPLNDDALGWDFPLLRDFVESIGKPFLLVRSDPLTEDGARALSAEAAAFARGLSRERTRA